MNNKLTLHITIAVAVMAVMTVIGCSTQKNTSTSRWWHSFNSRYNTYYNGSLAYVDASLEKENGNKDNFTEMLPLYTVGNKASRDLGKANYDRAIEKCQKVIKLHSIKKRPEWNKSRKKTARDIEWLNRKEYNPFLWKAWMLMGRSQFMKGSFDEAASTFAYMSRLYESQPAIYGRARAWLAKCYVEQDWMYDAEDVMQKMRKDSVTWRARKEWDFTYADYYIKAGRYEEAVPYMKKVIKHEKRRKQKAREWFIMGQLQAALGNRQEAYKAYRKVVAMNPPYELEFNARIAMTEVMAGGKWKQMVGKLRRMARNDNNKEYLDQVYYAIGNIYMNQKDTLKAIEAYEKGNAKSTRNGIEKGVLLLTLGDIYWQRQSFNDAQRCYGEAIGLLDKERKDYKQLSERSKILDELVPHTDAVHLQDSLQALAKMPEKERLEAIDRVIEALKKKEKAERDAQAEQEAQQKIAQNGGTGNQNQNSRNQQTSQSTQDKNGTWYFYNPMAINQGKQNFQKLWGKRENVDDWQRVNKTVVATGGATEEFTDEMRDSLANVVAMEDSVKALTDSAQNDPHKREYYLAQIPFTDEQVEASNVIIMDGLYNSGVIFKDKLDNLPLSEKQLRRLADDYPQYEKMDNAYYHLFLLYNRMGLPSEANGYVDKLKEKFPDSEWTALLSDPNFIENSKYGVHLEDSLYAATYEAFKADRLREVKSNVELSATRFPLGTNRDKFIFFDGMAKLNGGDANGCIEDMKTVVEKYPKSEVSTLAGMIINGVKSGRKLHGGKFDISDVWARRAVVMSDSDSVKARKFEAERNTDFTFMIAFQPDSVNGNQLLYELARHNFSNYLVRNFDINTEEFDGLSRMSVSGFKNYDEALQYARELYANQKILSLAHKCRTIIISNKNLELLGTQYSYDDYDKFYEKHFVPLRISTVRLLTEPESVEYEKREDDSSDNGNKVEEDKLVNGGVVDDDTYLQLGIDAEAPENNDNGIPMPTDDNSGTNGGNTIDVPADNSIDVPASNGNVIAPAKDNNMTAPAEDNGISVKETEPEDATDGNDFIIAPQQTEAPATQTDSNDFDIDPKPKAQNGKRPDDNTATTKPETKSLGNGGMNGTATPPATYSQDKPQDSPKATTSEKKDEPVIDFSDDNGNEYNIQPENNGNKKQQRQEFNLEDDFYELDGF